MKYVVWGIKPSGKHEEPLAELSSEPAAKLIAAFAERNDFRAVRIQLLDMSTPPDFIGAIKRSK